MTVTGGLILMQILFLILWFANVIAWSLWLIFTPGILVAIIFVFVVLAVWADD